MDKLREILSFRQVSVAFKLRAGFGAIILLIGGMVIASYVLLGGISSSLETIRDVAFPQAIASIEIDSSINQIILGIESAADAGVMGALDRPRAAQKKVSARISELKKLLRRDTGAQKSLDAVDGGVRGLLTTGEELVSANLYQEWERIPEILKRFTTAKEELQGQVTALRKDGVRKLEGAIGDINERSGYTRSLGIVLGSLSLAIGILLTLTISFSIMGPISSIVQVMKKAEKGDFTSRHGEGSSAGARDEFAVIGRAIDNMMEGLVGIFGMVRQAASEVQRASEELLALSRKIKDGSTLQSQSVDEVTSSIDEMNATIKNVAADVENYYSAAEESNTSILELSASVDQVAGSADSLKVIVERTTSLLDELTASIREVAASSDGLSGQVGESSTALAQIDASIKEVMKGTQESSQLVNLVMERLTKEGFEAVRRSASSISEINEVVQDAAQVIRSLGEKSSDIGRMLTVIDEVSDQTRLLSLNAAILAAQSGTQGRAFSVVAEEIRALSDRTSSSTREITQLLKTVPLEIDRITQSIDQGTEKVEEGMKLVRELEETIMVVAESARKASEASTMITTATGEQAEGIRQAAQFEQNIALMSREIAAATRHQAVNCEKILDSAKEMRDLALQLKRTTDEQAAGTKLIGKSSTESIKIAKNISASTKEEARGSELIVQAISAVSQATDRNLDAVSNLGEVVDLLAQHSRLMEEEMEKFRI